MNLVKVECVFCGKEFFRSRGRFNEARKFGWNQYCSLGCLSKHRTKRRVLFCENCGKQVTRCPNDISPHNYCSQSCAAKANNRKYPKRQAKLRVCLICNKKFKGNRGRKYCSEHCKLIAQRRHTPQQLIEIIKQTAQALKRVPTKRELKEIADACANSFGSWNKAIVAASLQPNRSHNQRMYKCANAKALDGHICASISELIIDNWLTENKITHERDISYPNTNHKADWGINLKGHTIFVEYFGLAKDSPRYDRSIKEKKDICRKYKIKLLEIYPQNLYSKGGVVREKLKEKFQHLMNL